jgi:hypothetical protein
MTRRGTIRTTTCVLALMLAVLAAGPDAHADGLFLSVGPMTPLPSLEPGVTADDTGSVAVVASTPSPLTGSATLTVADLSGYGVPGHLYNAGFSLASPLQAAAATSATGATVAALADISDQPLTLVTYTQAVTDDPVTVTFSQHLDASQALRTGTYAKPVTFTLTASP